MIFMRIIIYIYIAILLVSCSFNNDDVVQLTPNASYLLNPTDTLVELNQDLIDSYLTQFETYTSQAPLTKYVQSSKYEIYFSLLLEPNIDVVKKRILEQLDYKKINFKRRETEAEKYFSFFISKDTVFYYVNLMQSDNNSYKLATFLTSPDSLLTYGLYEQDFISNSINR